MKTNFSSSCPTRRKKEKTRKSLEVEKTRLFAKMYEGNNEIIEIFKREEKEEMNDLLKWPRNRRNVTN